MDIKGKLSIGNILMRDNFFPLPFVELNGVPWRMKKLVLTKCTFLHLKNIYHLDSRSRKVTRHSQVSSMAF